MNEPLFEIEDFNKKCNKGLETLIPRNEWVPEKEIQGTDEMVLNHPMMEKAFRRIVELFKPKHEIALVSLCTSTRPYSNSRKWKTFKNMFSNKVDLIICSNGGIIPIEFENCYPYLTYDAHGNKKYDEMYIKKIYERLCIFFERHKYKKIIFNFRPNLRNRISALKFIDNYNDSNTKFYVLPSEEAYNKNKEEGYKLGMYFPDLYPNVLKEISDAIYE